MRTYNACIPCFIRQAHDALQHGVENETLVHRTLQRVLVEAARFPMNSTPPLMAQRTHRIIRTETGDPDPYAELKAESTAWALQLMPQVRAAIRAAVDPFLTAVRFSIAGNVLDFALTPKWSLLEIDDFIEQSRLHPVDEDSVRRLQRALESADTILLLGDNAGETVFDRLLIERMPAKTILYAVKGSPVINDAVRADAEAAGLDRVAELVENGSDAPGTILSDCSDAFRRLFETADVVVAKGQANYESLCDSDRPVFFLTRVKCPVIAADIAAPVGAWIVREHRGAVA